MAGQKVLIIGGGFGGVAAARTARSLLDREHDVVLVDRDRRTYLCGSFPMLIIGEREPLKVSRSLPSLANRGIGYVQAEVTSIDVAAQTVSTSSGILEYDHLVLATGVEYDWGAVPGAANAFSFYDLHSARRLRRRLSSFRKGKVVIAVSSLPYKCPPAPIEAAMLLTWDFKRRGLLNDTEVHIFTPEPAALPVAGPEGNASLLKDFMKRGIHTHTGLSITEVARGGREASFSDGSSMDADLVITIPVHRVPHVIQNSGVAKEAGWVKVSPRTLQASRVNVYAVGDINIIPMSNGRPLPKAGVFASAEGETVGHNIAAALNGTPPIAFPGRGYCFIAYSGSQAGQVRGNFLSEGSPSVTVQRPSGAGHRAKERFEHDWKRFRI